VSKERYNQAIDKIDYDISQLETKYKAEKINEANKEKGSTEYEVSEKEKDKLKEKYLTPLEKKL
jgi:phosphopantetheine adenylyltransferase